MVASGHRLHVAEAAVKGDESALEGLDDVGRGEARDEEDRVALDLGDVHAALDAAHDGVEELVEDGPAVVDLGLLDESRVAGDVGEDEGAFLEAGELLGAVGLARHRRIIAFRDWR